MSFIAGDSLTPCFVLAKLANSLQRDDVRTSGPARRSVKRRHWLVIDNLDAVDPEAVESGAHCAAVCPEHADLDIISGLDVSGQLERPGHMVEIVASWPVEAESDRLRPRRLVAKKGNREAPAHVRGIEQRPIGTVVDVEFVAAPLFHANDKARIFGAQRAAGL